MSDFPPAGAAGAAGTTGPSGPRADFGLRFVALLIDGVINFVAQLILNLALGDIGQLVSLVFGFAYFVYFEGSPSGQTPGKKVMNIRVIDFQTGGELGYGKAVIRQVMRYVSGAVCLLGYLWMLWDKEKQTWHDKVSGAVVVPTSAYPVDKWPG